MAAEADHHMDVPRHPEVPEDVHQRVVAQVQATMQARREAAGAVTSSLASWEREVFGETGGTATEQEARGRIEQAGLSVEGYQAVSAAGRAQWTSAHELGPTSTPAALPDKKIIVQVPSTYTAPYMGSAWWQTVSGGGWVVEPATAFPSQPNGQSRESDPASGIVGTGLAAQYNGGFGSSSVVATEYEMVGVWVKTVRSSQFVLANIAPSSIQFHTTASLYPAIGGGSATLTSSTMIECFTGSESADHADASAAGTRVNFTAALGDPQSSTGSLAAQQPSISVAYAPGTWIWVLAGTYQRVNASVSNAGFAQASVFATMKVSNLVLWL
jgi:hypothetical protein